jgi:hypothetical protein
MAVLIGSTYAHIIFLIAQDHLAIGIFISLFVAFMGYIKTDPHKEYFGSVCAQSASIITFISNQEGLQGSNRAVLSRTSLTFLGIFIHVLISNVVLPISARELVKKKVNQKHYMENRSIFSIALGINYDEQRLNSIEISL